MGEKFFETKASRVRFLRTVGIVLYSTLFIASIVTFCYTGFPPVFDRSNTLFMVWFFTAAVIISIALTAIVIPASFALFDSALVALAFLSSPRIQREVTLGVIKKPSKSLREISPAYNAFVVGTGKVVAGITRVITLPFWGPGRAIRNWIDKGRE